MGITTALMAKTGKALLGAGKTLLPMGLSYLNYQRDRQQQDRAFKMNKQFWRERFDATNEYNAPLSQVQRLEEAGLNKALMYGKGSASAGVANMGSVEGAKAAKSNVGTPDQLGWSTQMANLKANTNNVTSQAALNAIDLAKKQKELPFAQDLAASNTELAYWTAKQQKEKYVQEEINSSIKNETKAAEIFQVYQNVSNLIQIGQNLTSEGEIKALIKQAKTYENELLQYGIKPTDNMFMQVFYRLFDAVKDMAKSQGLTFEID